MPRGLPAGFRVATLCGSIKPLFSGTDDYNETLIEALCQQGIDVRPIDLGSWGVSMTGKLLQAVAAARPDAILLQYPTDSFGRSFAPHVFALLQRIAPLIVTLHEFTAGHVLRRLSVGPLLLRASVVVATAEREAQSLVQWYPGLRNRLRIIPVGANVPAREWAPASSPEVLYFGQIRPKKGLEEFIACRDQLSAALPQPRFTVIGSPVPQFARFFEQIASEARARGITLLTGLDKQSVSDRLAAAWVALLPFPDGASFRRGSLLAAAVCGVPIVARTGQDTPPNLATLLPPATTVEEMTTLVARCLDDPAARQAAHERSRKLGDMVGWTAIANSYIDVFGGLSGVGQPAFVGAA